MNLEKYSKIRPIDDKIIIKKHEKDTQTSGGIYLPEMSQDNAKIGTIVAIGPGMKEYTSEKIKRQLLTENSEYNTTDDIRRIPMYCKVGQTVIYSNTQGMKFEYDNEDLIIQRESDLLCILD